jgi:hypothetical protein
MNRILAQLGTIVFLCISSAAAVAQDTLPYKDGPVVMVTSVRTQPGKFNEYFRYLTGPYSQMMNQAKQQGLLSSFAFYAAFPKSPEEPDLYIVETYPNMAVFDSMSEKMTAIGNKVFGSLKQSDAADANREEIRKILGTEMIRELVPVKTSATQ